LQTYGIAVVVLENGISIVPCPLYASGYGWQPRVSGHRRLLWNGVCFCPPYQVDRKTNEIKALPELIRQLALKGVLLAFDAINTPKKLAS